MTVINLVNLALKLGYLYGKFCLTTVMKAVLQVSFLGNWDEIVEFIFVLLLFL